MRQLSEPRRRWAVNTTKRSLSKVCGSITKATVLIREQAPISLTMIAGCGRSVKASHAAKKRSSSPLPPRTLSSLAQGLTEVWASKMSTQQLQAPDDLLWPHAAFRDGTIAAAKAIKEYAIQRGSLLVADPGLVELVDMTIKVRDAGKLPSPA